MHFFLLRKQEKAAEAISANSESASKKMFAEALRRSFRIAAEDCAREAGYMLPQSETVKQLLEDVLSDTPGGLEDDIKTLLKK